MQPELFSKSELKILELLKDQKMSIRDLAHKFYKNKPKPMQPNNNVCNFVHRINQKCEYHKLPWFINGYGAGRAGRDIWIDS